MPKISDNLIQSIKDAAIKEYKESISPQWEESFDSIFSDYFVIKTGLLSDHKAEIKSFIRSTLSHSRQSLKEKIEGMRKEYKDFEKETPYFSINENMRRHESYNQALTDVDKLLD